MSKNFFYSFSKTDISKIIEHIALAVMQLCQYLFTHKTTGRPLCVQRGGGEGGSILSILNHMGVKVCFFAHGCVRNLNLLSSKFT